MALTLGPCLSIPSSEKTKRLLKPPHLPPNLHRPLYRHVSPRMCGADRNPNLLSSITTFLWSNSLPPQLLIAAVRSAWTSAWQIMMSQMAPSDSSGSYARPPSKFKSLAVGSRQKKPPKKYHLYVALACPWAHRTLIVRALKGFEEAIPVSIASPGVNGSWEFKSSRSFNGDRSDYTPGLDKANGCKTLKEVYGLRHGGYDGRSTVPMLWDIKKRDVACNESFDIIEFLNSGFDGEVGDSGLDLSPPELDGKINEWYDLIYPNVNNGVYRCGFAQSQEAYDSAVEVLFSTLDKIDAHLATNRYLCGDALTLADICLFTTLIRFDLVYNVLFKCTKKKLIEYPNLHGYMLDIYQIPKVAATCNFDAIMDGYYRILFLLNPGGIRPAMPLGYAHEALSKPPNREMLSKTNKFRSVSASSVV
ncbi:uncharacterized protein LOC18447337 [Amborella trichopoda]|uniref:GST C-terminal domain-containing protein n=1 Tax=Amborella trichopoda TaxID=13333 RepID=U5D9S0_AMBTC|nr:uncharacterized protein LOC18447337 [Amborella trichopoda]ERN18965.1 hypothetical protein AMTR_s00067p00206610 [Amborella trichopoda]|eukprot:XP_006857498.3 uncharacterized protein LOC18447337 [Amborella trichopoda]